MAILIFRKARALRNAAYAAYKTLENKRFIEDQYYFRVILSSTASKNPIVYNIYI